MPSQFPKPLNYNDLLPPIVLAVPHASGAATLVLPAGAGARLGPLAADRFFRVTALRNPGSEREVVLAVLKATGIDVSTNTLQNVTGDEGFGNVALPAGTTIEVRPTAKDYEEHSVAINANEAALAAKQRSLALVDVRDYGAVGDGVADDTAAVQAAVDVAVATGRPLYLPPGTWLVTGVVAHGRIDVFGAGAGASALRGMSWATAPLLAVAVAPNTVPTAASLSTLTRSADFGSTGLSAGVRCLSLTHARIVKDALNGLADFTIEFVARSAPVGQSAYLQVADAGLDGGTTARLLLHDAGRTAYTLTLRLKQAGGTYVTSTFSTWPAAPSTTVAEHVAFVRSGTTVKVYLAGLLKQTYTAVTGTLEVKPLDEVTLFGQSDLPFYRSFFACCSWVDSIGIFDSALYSAAFTPPVTVPNRTGSTLLWWNADQPQSGGTTPVASTSWDLATIQDPNHWASQACNLSTFRDFTLEQGAIGLYLSGAPGSRIDRVDASLTRCPIWLNDNCYHSSIRDCNLTQPQIGVIARVASGDLTVDNVHAGFTLTAGIVLVGAQGQVVHRRCYVDGQYAAAYVASTNVIVVYEACIAGEEGRPPTAPLVAPWLFDDSTDCTLRDCAYEGGVGTGPVILGANSDAANGHVVVEGSRFYMHASIPSVLSFAGVQPAATASVRGSWKSPDGVPWAAAGQASYVAAGTAGRVSVWVPGPALSDDDDLLWDSPSRVLTVGATQAGMVKAGPLPGFASFGGVWLAQASPSIFNYSLAGGSADTLVGGSSTLQLRINNSTRVFVQYGRTTLGFGVVESDGDPTATVTSIAVDPTYAALTLDGAPGQAAPLLRFRGVPPATASRRELGYLDAGFISSTDATYTGYVSLSAQDYTGTRREGVRVASDGTQALITLSGPVTATGPIGANAAAGNLRATVGGYPGDPVNFAGVWFAAAPTTSNFALLGTATGDTIVNAAATLDFRVGNTSRFSVNSSSITTFRQILCLNAASSVYTLILDTESTSRLLQLESTSVGQKTLILKRTAGQTAPFIEYQDEAGASLAAVRPDGSWKPPQLADSAAVNDSLYYSTTQGKLCYRDSGGVSRPLY